MYNLSDKKKIEEKINKLEDEIKNLKDEINGVKQITENIFFDKNNVVSYRGRVVFLLKEINTNLKPSPYALNNPTSYLKHQIKMFPIIKDKPTYTEFNDPENGLNDYQLEAINELYRNGFEVTLKKI